MNEIFSREEHEALEAKLIAAREAFFEAVARDPVLSRLLGELHELEALAVDSRRSLREAEITEGSAS